MKRVAVILVTLVSSLIGVSARHPRPTLRMALADEHLRSVLDLSVDPFSAHLGLAVVSAARRGGLLLREEDLAAVARWGVTFRSTLCLPRSEADEAIKLLQARGANPASIEQLIALKAGQDFHYCD